MAGKKSAAPTHVFVVMGHSPAAYNQSPVTLQGVYADEQTAVTAASYGAALVQKVVVNYSGVDNATDADTEGKTSTKTKPQTKTPKTTAQSNGETASKETNKKKVCPDGQASSLVGMTLATSGTLSTLTRDTFNETVEKFGGLHTNKLADATTIVLGTNPGPKKLEEIAEKNYPTMTEEEFYDMIGADYIVPTSKRAKKA